MNKYTPYLINMHKVLKPEPSPIRRKPKPRLKPVHFCIICCSEPTPVGQACEACER